MLKVAITHDVDRIKKTYQYFTHFTKSVTKGDFKMGLDQMKSLFLKEPYWTFPNIIELESSLNIKSTFFFLNESINLNIMDIKSWPLALGRYNIYNKKLMETIRWLDKNGWEIGVHGSYNSYNDLELLKLEKYVLEKIVGHEILGIRQHHLNIGDKTWAYQHLAGFRYDSSFGFNSTYGFKDEKYNAFFPFNNEFMEIPLIIMDDAFVPDSERWMNLQKIMDDVKERDGLLVLNWHSDNFNESEFPGYVSSFKTVIDECLKRNAKFYKLNDYYNEVLSTKNKI